MTVHIQCMQQHKDKITIKYWHWTEISSEPSWKKTVHGRRVSAAYLLDYLPHPNKHTYTHTHTPFFFSAKPGLAGCPLDFPNKDSCATSRNRASPYLYPLRFVKEKKRRCLLHPFSNANCHKTVIFMCYKKVKANLKQASPILDTSRARYSLGLLPGLQKVVRLALCAAMTRLPSQSHPLIMPIGQY